MICSIDGIKDRTIKLVRFSECYNRWEAGWEMSTALI